MKSGFLSKRNLAIFFGATLVLTVVIVAAAVGVGHPSVPSDDVAVVDDSSIDVPGLAQDGHISKTNFNHFLEQTAKQNGLQAAPQPSDPQYKQIRDQAMQTALQIAWIVGEANRQGLSFTDTQIQQSLQQIKSQFKNTAEYEKARDQAGLTEADVLERAKLQLIQNTIQDNITKSASAPSTSDARDYYDANKSQFTQPAKRTIRVILNSDAHKIDQAYQALRADSSDANWKKVAAAYSTDPTSKAQGGLRPDVVPGSFQEPLDSAIFKAPLHEVQGPVHTSTGNYVYEVESATPSHVTGFDETQSNALSGGAPQKVSDQIVAQLKSEKQQEALSDFSSDFRDYWTNLTQCASDYVVQGCDNFNGGGPTCDPSKLGPSQTGGASPGCPAPVFAACQESSAAQGGTPGTLQCTGTGPAPGAPGSFKPFVPVTGGAPQGPHPPGAGSAASSTQIPSNLSIPSGAGGAAPPGG